MSSFRIFVGIIAVAALISGSAFGAPETISAGLRDSLSKISDSLFAAHRHDYIIVDAVRDGYVELGKRFSMTHDSATFTVDGKPLPAEATARYLSRYRDFMLYGGEPNPWIGLSKITSDAWTKKDILDLQSSFRKVPPAKEQLDDHLARRHDIDKILGEMYRDGVIVDSLNYDLSFGPGGLLINSMVLSPALDEKYRMLFRIMMDIVPKDTGNWGYTARSRGGTPGSQRVPKR